MGTGDINRYPVAQSGPCRLRHIVTCTGILYFLSDACEFDHVSDRRRFFMAAIPIYIRE